MSANKYTSKLAGQRVLVLGGTSGIGFCVAEASLEAGATVTISSSTQPKLDAALSRLRSSYPDASSQNRIHGQTCDLRGPVTPDASTQHAFDESLITLLRAASSAGPTSPANQHAEEPKLNHIVYTAGDALTIKPPSEVSSFDVITGMRVRVLGATQLAKHAPSFLAPSASSSFTLTGGVNSDKPSPGWGVAAAIGAALEGLARGLAVDLKPLRVNLVSPGAILTELWDGLPSEMRTTAMERFADKTLVGKIGTPEDTAEAFLYLMKDGFVTGEVLRTNGGALLV